MFRMTVGFVLVVLSTPAGSQGSAAAVPAGAAAPPERCAAVSALRLPDLRITHARHEPADPTPAAPVHVPHCRATGVIGTEIGFSVWLPDDWNGRFLMVGGGGFVGSIPGPGNSVDRGFAVTSTDTGHTNQGIDARWALRNMERQVNYAYLAVHRTAVTARFIVREYYARDPHHAYFVGCSTGGRQGLMEAQRFPDDFDGVVSGAPVFDWTRVVAAGLKNAQAAFPDPSTLASPIITTDSLKLLQMYVLKACDAKDGVTDGVIDDPRACRFDLATVPSCPGDAAAPECLTHVQRTAIQRIYAPLTDDAGLAYEGQPLGAEAAAGGWQQWITGPNDRAFADVRQPALGWGFSTEFFKYFVFADPSWDYARYDVAKSWRRDTQLWTSLMNADNPDLSAFRARHGKLLLWHGWADPALNPLATIRYYDDVTKRDSRAREDVRLFMLPGVLHCAGGPGPDRFDKLDPIVEWVEHGTVPATIVVTKDAAADQGARSRPVCAYPARATFNGSGSTDDAKNFSCR